MKLVAVALAVVAALSGGQADAAVRPARCDAGAIGARCATIAVPLDRTRPGGPRIRVFFEQYRPPGRRPVGTIVAIEGGPGYPTWGSRDSYLGLFRPLLRTRRLILVDLRGTGRSGALDCPAFHDGVGGYIGRAGRCALELGARRDSYGTGEAAEDVDDVLRALGAGQIDLYGDSYGTYAAQTFAYRHPERLRSLVLDASYPLPGTDPALADLASGSRRALRLACARRPSCAARHVDPVAALAQLVARVRRAPLALSGPDGDGVERALRGRATRCIRAIAVCASGSPARAWCRACSSTAARSGIATGASCAGASRCGARVSSSRSGGARAGGCGGRG